MMRHYKVIKDGEVVCVLKQLSEADTIGERAKVLLLDPDNKFKTKYVELKHINAGWPIVTPKYLSTFLEAFLSDVENIKL